MNASFPLSSLVSSDFCSSSPSPRTRFVLHVGPWIRWIFFPTFKFYFSHAQLLQNSLIDWLLTVSSQLKNERQIFNFYVTYKFYNLRVLKLDSMWRWIFCLFSWLLMSSSLQSSYTDTKNLSVFETGYFLSLTLFYYLSYVRRSDCLSFGNQETCFFFLSTWLETRH